MTTSPAAGQTRPVTGAAPPPSGRAAAEVTTVVNRAGIRSIEPLTRPYIRRTPASTTAVDFGN